MKLLKMDLKHAVDIMKHQNNKLSGTIKKFRFCFVNPKIIFTFVMPNKTMYIHDVRATVNAHKNGFFLCPKIKIL